jgi:endogenous inhibitor of DNA gyrase (YacG/DUF329 family)
MELKRCPRCGAEMSTKQWPPKPGRPSIWCSQRCRRAAYEERRAAANGAIAVRVEVAEKVVERIIERVRVETQHALVQPADAAQIVVGSPRACRTVLEALAADADAGRLNTGAHAPMLRAADRLLQSLTAAGLVSDR